MAASFHGSLFFIIFLLQLYDPPIGWRNSTDGGRSILFPDYRQA